MAIHLFIHYFNNRPPKITEKHQSSTCDIAGVKRTMPKQAFD